jgi:hypothetical protein
VEIVHAHRILLALNIFQQRIIWQTKNNVKLVGGIPTPLKNMKVSWDENLPNIYISGKS